MKVALEVEAVKVDGEQYDSGYTWTLWCGRSKIAQVWAETEERVEVTIPRLLFEATQMGAE